MIDFTIVGQMKSGKNGMQVTRMGHHFPKPEWAAWRNQAVLQIKSQLPMGFKTITEPISVVVNYTKSDKRRRDVPGMADALYHVLERAGVLADDSLAEDLYWTCAGLDRDNPGITIRILDSGDTK